MKSGGLPSRIAVAVGGAAIVATGALTACGSGPDEASPATNPASNAPAVSPTEKAVDPDYDESFTPSVDPTPPSAVCEEVINGVCVR